MYFTNWKTGTVRNENILSEFNYTLFGIAF